MANNREISQFAGLVTVNDTTNQVSIGSTLNLSGGDLTLDKGSGTDAVLALQMGTGGGATNESRINFANSSGSVLFDAAFDNSAAAERFKISSDQAGEAVTLLRNGNVGINSASPATALNIGEGGVLRLGNASNSRFTSFFNDANFSEWTADVDPLRLRAQHSSAYIRFDTNGSERLRITQNGHPWIRSNISSTSFTNNSTVTILTIGSESNAVVKFIVQAADTGYRQAEWAGEYTAFVSDAAGAPGVSYYLNEHWQDVSSSNWNSPTVTVSINSSGQVQFNATNSNSDANGTVYVTILAVTSRTTSIPTLS